MNEAQVSCYSGHTYAQRPDFFQWQGTEHRVREVERAWQEPGERHFLVRTEEDRVFDLSYHEPEERWWAIELVGA